MGLESESEPKSSMMGCWLVPLGDELLGAEEYGVSTTFFGNLYDWVKCIIGEVYMLTYILSASFNRILSCISIRTSDANLRLMKNCNVEQRPGKLRSPCFIASGTSP